MQRLTITLLSICSILTISGLVYAKPVSAYVQAQDCHTFRDNGGTVIGSGPLQHPSQGKRTDTNLHYRVWKLGTHRCAVIWNTTGAKWSSLEIVRSFQYASGTCYQTTRSLRLRVSNANTVAMKYEDIYGTSERDLLSFYGNKNGPFDYYAEAYWKERSC